MRAGRTLGDLRSRRIGGRMGGGKELSFFEENLHAAPGLAGIANTCNSGIAPDPSNADEVVTSRGPLGGRRGEERVDGPSSAGRMGAKAILPHVASEAVTPILPYITSFASWPFFFAYNSARIEHSNTCAID